MSYIAIKNDNIHYGSGFLVKMVEEAGKVYNKKFPGSFFNVNDLSKKAGGKVSGHASHQNGLDVDISLPRKSNGKFDYAKSWAILKSFVDLKYVDVVFLNATRKKEFCNYLKTSGEKDYQRTFRKLYTEEGHKTHMHVRLECTNHNIGCKKASYTASNYGVCK